MGDGGQKRIALDGNIKGLCKEKLLVCGKDKLFQLMQSNPIKKSIFQHTKISISHRTKANAQLQILSATTYCELAAQSLFFEKHRSCVCTAVTLSHRFKSLPAILGKMQFSA